MKPSKKKPRVRKGGNREVRVNGEVAGDDQKEDRRVIDQLVEAFSSASLEEATWAYREANGDANKAAEILGGLLENGNVSPTSSSSSNGTGKPVFAKACRGRKQKKVVASAGTISSVLGKEYVMSSPRRNSHISKGINNNPISNEEAEQFLYSMLGDDCEMSMDVVRDVLCQCRYDVEKALDALLNLSTTSYNQFKSSGHGDYNKNDIQDRRVFIECSDSDSLDSTAGNSQLTYRPSDSTLHLSEDFQGTLLPPHYNCRDCLDVVISDKEYQSRPGTEESDLHQKVLESLFNIPKSSEHEPSSMNWKIVVKKMKSLGQGSDLRPHLAETQQNVGHGDEYQVFRKAAQQHWSTMKSCYQKATTAYLKGERTYAAYLSEQGEIHKRRAREADEKASQDIFIARNKRIENVITIDLHGQHVKQAIRILKVHLIYTTYMSSIQSLRVITGCGTHGVGKGKLKKSVISLLEKEGIGWSEENQGTVLIKIDGRKEFNFVESETDSESM